ncbi:Fic family protein [Halosquirtibacter laminarini]|uniref:Fic family protein n=1 Tax=Halosquirtibacter laminarini TaxID=3374600 RepID=A0AC61NM25_9BACT|nr:Fic family protein [Prolixibacteraceae bacterium]
METPPKVDFKDLYSDYLSGDHNLFLSKMEEEYLYWNKFKYKVKGDQVYGKDVMRAWGLVQLDRKTKSQTLKIGSYQFRYWATNKIQERCYHLNGLISRLNMPQDDFVKLMHKRFKLEAISSSQIEGASTTTEEAISMIDKAKKPKDDSEQMILNNFHAYQFIVDNQQRELDDSFLMDIQEILVKNTKSSDKVQIREKQVYVTDNIKSEAVHIPPEASELRILLDDLYTFIKEDNPFIHPIVKSAILHFMIGYIHPFLDGNGRTARTLLYWYLFKKGYRIMHLLSVTEVIKKARSKYDKSFIECELDHNDLTYFINYSLEILEKAFEDLIQYNEKKKNERDEMDRMYAKISRQSQRLKAMGSTALNERQINLLSYLYVKPDKWLSVQEIAEVHHTERQTARKDVNLLLKQGFLLEDKHGRNVVVKLNNKAFIESWLAQA